MGGGESGGGVSVLGRDEGLQVGPALRRHGGIAGDVEEHQVEGDVVRDESQQHHRVPPEAVVLVQHPEDTPSWPEEAGSGSAGVVARRRRRRHVASLTQDLADADEDARDADQTLGVVAEAVHGADAGAVHAAVKGQLQAWRGRRRRRVGINTCTHTYLYTISQKLLPSHFISWVYSHFH